MGLHQRIVSLFETLARKHGRLVEGLAGAVDEKEDEGFTEVSEAVQDAAVLEEVDYKFLFSSAQIFTGVTDGVGDSEFLSGPPNPAQPKPYLCPSLQEGTV